MEKPYSILITKEEVFARTGYDLTKALNKGHFPTIDGAIDQFLDEVARNVYFEILKYNTPTRATKLLACTSLAYPLKEAQLMEAEYILENGDQEVSADKKGPAHNQQMQTLFLRYNIIPRMVGV